VVGNNVLVIRTGLQFEVALRAHLARVLVVVHLVRMDDIGAVADLDIAGQGTKSVKAGDTIHVNRETVHGGKVASATPVKLLAVHIVGKGKPLAEPARDK